jgi:hypothetical protein
VPNNVVRNVAFNVSINSLGIVVSDPLNHNTIDVFHNNDKGKLALLDFISKKLDIPLAFPIKLD